MRKRRLRKLVRSVVLGAFVVGALAGPAAADPFQIISVSGLEDVGGIDVAALLAADHAGTMKITLYKKNATNWRKIATKTAFDPQIPGAFIAFFNTVNGNRTCKAKATFRAPDHTPATKRTQFAC